MSCNATTRKGKTCRFRTNPGVNYCLNHQHGANTASAAARAATLRHAPAIQTLETAMSLTDRSAIQAVLDSILRLTLSGHITPERAGIAIRICSVAARNFDSTGDTLEGPRPAIHDWSAYFSNVHSILSSIDPLLAKGNATDGEGAGE